MAFHFNLAPVLALLRHATHGLAALNTDLDTLLVRLSAAKSSYLNELSSAHMPADLDTLKTRLSEYRAGLLNYLTELGSAHIPADIDTLLSRLTAARAGYLNYLTELSSAHIPADIDTLKARLTAVRAGYLDYLASTTYGLSALKDLIDALRGGVEGIQDIKEALDAELDTARGKYTKTMTGGEDDLYGESSDTEFRLQEFRVDLHNMVEGDTILIKVYTTEDGTERQISNDEANIFTGPQVPARQEIIGSSNMVWGREDISVTAEQKDGTNKEIVCYWRDSKRGG